MINIPIKRFYGFQRAFNELLSSGKMEIDKSQNDAIKYLSKLSIGLEQNNPKSSFWNIFNSSHKSGAYLYGSVGSGKTMLMDLFYDNVRIKQKSRYHFNQFMLKFHKDLRELRKNANLKDPTKELINNYCQQTKLICLDEFQVITNLFLLILCKKIFF